MNNLETQVKDWVEISRLFRAAKRRFGTYQKETIQQAYHKIKLYYETYEEKFDPFNVPGRNQNGKI